MSRSKTKLTDEQKEALHKLNPRQQQFVLNLIKGMNQTKAYKEAGYKPKTDENAAVMGARMLRNVHVRAAYDALSKPQAEERAAEAVADRSEALEILSNLARRELDPDSQSHSDKITAIKLLAQLEGWDKASEKDHTLVGGLASAYETISNASRGRPPNDSDE